MKKILVFLVAAAFLMSFVAAGTADDAIMNAANRLVATQNDDGGWDWNAPDTNFASPSPNNTIGVTAQALVDAYVLNGNISYRDAAIVAADKIDFATDTQRIRGPDISFLVELSEATGDSSYASLAKTEFEEAKINEGNGSATGLAEYIRNGRIGQGYEALVAWDIDLYVQGASALDRYFPGQGYENDAEDMTEVIYDFMYSTFNFADKTEPNYWLSHTGSIDAFTSTGLHETERDTLVANLLASQNGDGSFPADDDWTTDDQTTAYAIIALLKAGENSAANDAVQYLINSQESNGGWSLGTGETEVTSEAAQALYDTLNENQEVEGTLEDYFWSISVTPNPLSFGIIPRGSNIVDIADNSPIKISTIGSETYSDNVYVTVEVIGEDASFYNSLLELNNGGWTDVTALGVLEILEGTVKDYAARLHGDTSNLEAGPKSATIVYTAYGEPLGS